MYSYVSYTGNGSQIDFAVPFPYLQQSHVEATVNGTPVALAFMALSMVRITPAPAVSATVVIRRNTSRAARLVDYSSGANVSEDTLDADSLQAFYLAQEALDQATVGAAFSTDAAGARVTNVANPANPNDAVNRAYLESYIAGLAIGGTSTFPDAAGARITNVATPAGAADAATKGYVDTAISGLGGGGGTDIRPLNNTFTGTNAFNNGLSVYGVSFSNTRLASQDLLTTNKGLYSSFTSSTAGSVSIGMAGEVKKLTGFGGAFGGQFVARMAVAGSAFAYGVYAEAWRQSSASFGTLTGIAGVVANLNGSNATGWRTGIDLTFTNRETGSVEGGAAPSQGIGGSGTSSNLYNSNSRALNIGAATRSDLEATYVGWQRGIVFSAGWADYSVPESYAGGVSYEPGRQVSYGGTGYVCSNYTSGSQLPTDGAYWVQLPDGNQRRALGIDFSGCDPTTRSRMGAGIKLPNGIPIAWDLGELALESYDPLEGVWSLKYNNVEQFGVKAATGDIRVKGIPRVLGTQSFVSAYRASSHTAPNGTSVMPFSNEEADYRLEYNPATYRFTPNTAGLYQFNAQLTTTTGEVGGNDLYVFIAKNGVAAKGRPVRTIAGFNNTVAINVVLTANGLTDYFEVLVGYSGSSVPIQGDLTASFLQVTKVA